MSCFVLNRIKKYTIVIVVLIMVIPIMVVDDVPYGSGHSYKYLNRERGRAAFKSSKLL